MATARRSYCLRIATDPICYVWTGHGLLDTPADSLDLAGATWKGAGAIVSLPAIKALISGVAERLTFTVSGVNAETLRLAIEDKDEIDGADVRLGAVEFDENWQLIGGVSYEWRGVADVITIESRFDGSKRVRTLVLSVASIDTRRANPHFSYWTDASQRLRAADDAFCDHVALISNSVTRRFGPTG